MNVFSRQLSHDPKNAITGSEIAPSSASAVNSVFLRDEKVLKFFIFSHKIQGWFSPHADLAGLSEEGTCRSRATAGKQAPKYV
jgi:hypothetical protein